jgi:hypothetical protein
MRDQGGSGGAHAWLEDTPALRGPWWPQSEAAMDRTEAQEPTTSPHLLYDLQRECPPAATNVVT